MAKLMVIRMNVGEVRKIPLDNNTAYLAGVIVGDGHLCNSKKSKNAFDYRIVVEVVDREYLIRVSELLKLFITTKSIVRECRRRPGKQQSYYFQVRNKSFYCFLTSDLQIPAGKKCYTVRVPESIFGSLALQKSFLAGFFDTDGGIRGRTIGFTSASEALIMDIQKILWNLNFSHQVEKWRNKKYNRTYFGIRLKARERDRFLKHLPLKNLRKINHSTVGVPEWPNGTEDLSKWEIVQA